MLNIEALNKAAEQRRFRFYGAAVEVELHPTRSRIVKEGSRQRHFPFYVCRWAAGGQRHAVLVEPILRKRIVPRMWPLRPIEVWEEDNEEMMWKVRSFVAQTQPAVDHG